MDKYVDRSTDKQTDIFIDVMDGRSVGQTYRKTD